MKHKLTHKQQRFVEEYLVDLNATQTAIRAGYSKKTAEVIGYENLKKPQIAAALDRVLKEQQERTQITADKVLEELAIVAFLNVAKMFNDDGELLPIKQMSEDMQRAVAGMDIETRSEGEDINTRTKIKLNNKLKALELLGKHFKMFTDKVEASDLNDPIVITWQPTAELTYDEWEQKAKEKLRS